MGIDLATTRRLYLVIEPGDACKAALRFTTRYTAQLDGQPGNTSCRVKVLRGARASLGASLADLLSAKLVVDAPSCWVHVSIIPPADAAAA